MIYGTRICDIRLQRASISLSCYDAWLADKKINLLRTETRRGYVNVCGRDFRM